MNLGETIAASKANYERVGADWYPTPPEATVALMDYLAPRGKLRILEPCCGDGRMSKVMLARGHEVTSSDKRTDSGFGKGGVDYLKLPEKSSRYYAYDAVITNPPFSHALPIITRAMKDAPIVCMLLSNNYWHAESRRRFFESRRPEAILALTWRLVFMEDRGNSPLANMIWTIWTGDQEGDTKYIPVKGP